MQNNRILFLTLRTFSATGGIEKMCRIVSKVLSELPKNQYSAVTINSMYDEQKEVDNKYVGTSIFKGFSKHKIRFSTASISAGLKSEVVILSHINLLVVGWIIKLISPRTKLILYTHGIEVWGSIPSWKKKILKSVDVFISVSRYTREKIISLYKLNPLKCIVLNNCLDPYLPDPQISNLIDLRKRYQIGINDKIILTLSRLSPHDRDKGYEKILLSLSILIKQFPELKYIIAGKYEQAEKQWLDGLINKLGLSSTVIFTGYVADIELADHLMLADVYVMPSTKEGFGIIFIEAMYYGTPVIAGNKDGSQDALCQGEFGLLIDPYNQTEITEAISKVLSNKEMYRPLRENLLSKFSYSVYKQKLHLLLQDLNKNVNNVNGL